jgi:dTDP-4-amino-4,6-dideoxygalactose transaminase
VPVEPWDRFREASGVPVVIDGAASFEGILRDPAATLGAVPVALSFHATKVFATGEGGASVTRDPGLALATLRALNFGFRMSRESVGASINGKMSEYHAAVGLASLNGWTERHAAIQAVAAGYREAFAVHRLDHLLITHPAVASNYVLLQLPDGPTATRVSRALAAVDIETRYWYGQRGLSGQPAVAELPRDSTPFAEQLSSCQLGLPVAPDLTLQDVAQVAAVVAATLLGTQPPKAN